MKLTASGGTDGANIVLFWPDNLPADADRELQDDPIGLVERLRDEGKLIWFPCDGDGGYSVAIFMHSPVPDELLASCEEAGLYPKLVAEGEAQFGGMEYMFKHDHSFLDKYPHMCGKVAVPSGTYSATVYLTDFPESTYDAWLLRTVGPAAKKLWELHGWFAGLSVAGVLATIVSVFVSPWTVWIWVLGGTLSIIGCAVALTKTKTFKTVANAQVKYEEEYPAYILQLEQLPEVS